MMNFNPDDPVIRKYRRRYQVLVVEDQASERQLMVDMLAELGIEAIAAQTGEAALKFLESTTVDLMLIDVALGKGITGLEVGYLAKQDSQHLATPIIAVTAYSEEKMTALDEIGFNGYLPKPYSILHLKQLLDHYLKEQPFIPPESKASDENGDQDNDDLLLQP
jgi:CheY-like chemotaxis protein